MQIRFYSLAASTMRVEWWLNLVGPTLLALTSVLFELLNISTQSEYLFIFIFFYLICSAQNRSIQPKAFAIIIFFFIITQC